MPDQPDPPALELMADRDGERLDVFLTRRLDAASRSQVRRLIDDGLARVDGGLERAGYRLRFGELVAVHERRTAPLEAATELELQVAYEDSQLAVIDKPAGLTVHPAPGEREATLIGALLARWPEIAALAEGEADSLRPGLAHRLDRDTTGLLMVAKTAEALESLRDQLRERSIEKRYLAVVAGIPDPEAGLIDAPLGRDPADPRRMAVVDRGRPAQTGYQIEERFADASVLECDLITGRTHQIRVHLSAIGHPIAGDTIYGFDASLIDRQALHARSLAFDHPASGERITLQADPPPDIRRLLAALREGELLTGPDQVPARNNPHRRGNRRSRKRRRTQRIR